MAKWTVLVGLIRYVPSTHQKNIFFFGYSTFVHILCFVSSGSTSDIERNRLHYKEYTLQDDGKTNLSICVIA